MKLKSEQNDTGSYEIFLENGACVADVWSTHLHRLPQTETDSLAALFVAAPDLLEALKRIADGFDGNNENEWRDIVNENREVARAAIAKAEPQNEQQ